MGYALFGFRPHGGPREALERPRGGGCTGSMPRARRRGSEAAENSVQTRGRHVDRPGPAPRSIWSTPVHTAGPARGPVGRGLGQVVHTVHVPSSELVRETAPALRTGEATQKKRESVDRVDRLDRAPSDGASGGPYARARYGPMWTDVGRIAKSHTFRPLDTSTPTRRPRRLFAAVDAQGLPGRPAGLGTGSSELVHHCPVAGRP